MGEPPHGPLSGTYLFQLLLELLDFELLLSIDLQLKPGREQSDQSLLLLPAAWSYFLQGSVEPLGFVF